MTLREVKERLEEYGIDVRKDEAITLLQEVCATWDDIVDEHGIDLDLRGLLSILLAVAVAADGELDSDEYAMYEELCEAIDAEAKDYDECKAYVSARSALVGKLENIVSGLKGAYTSVDDDISFDQLTCAMAYVMCVDGELGGDETRLLSFFVDDEGASSASSSFASAKSQENVKLVDYEASFSRDDDRYYFTIGAELKNPNPEHCARNVNVKVIVMDSSGRILETSENTIDYIDSNATFYYGDEFSIDRGVPANYRVQVNCDEFVSAPANSTFANGITCSHYNVSTNRWGSTEFTGNVHNGYNKKLYVELYFVFTNSAGKITGGTNTRVTLYGKSDDAFDIYLNTQVKRDKVRCSPTFDFMDLVD